MNETQELVVIEGRQLERLTYREQPVLSLSMVDEVHQRSKDTAGKNFRNNRDRFIMGEDYYELPYEEWSVLVGRNSSDQTETVRQNLPDQGAYLPNRLNPGGGHKGNMIFLTMSGYLMLAKSFTDDLSWNVQRMLVKSYFKLREVQALAARDAEKEQLKDELLAMHRKYTALLEKKAVYKSRMSQEEKTKIMELHNQGKEVWEIVREVGRSKAAISNIINYGNSSGRVVKESEE